MRRDSSFLLVATALHAVVLLVITVTPAKRPRLVRPAKEPETAEIEVEVASSQEMPQLAAYRPVTRESERDETLPRRVAQVAPGGSERETQAFEPPVPPEQPPAPPDEHDALPPGYRVAPTGLAGAQAERNPFLTAITASASEGGGEDKGAERAVRSQLKERDRNLGLGVSGPVVAAVEEVARTSTAAVESHAVLEVVADREGKIVSVTVSEASEDHAGWDVVARALLGALRTKRVHVAPGSRGVAMTIAIDSREALPSGAAPGVNVTLFDQKVAHGKNERSASISILPLARIPITAPVPGRPGETQTKTIVLPIPMPNISGTFDETDLAAPAARVVHAHATNEREL